MSEAATPLAVTSMKAICSVCGGERNCEIHGKHVERGSDEHYSWYKEWFILECRGCEHVFALTLSSNSEDVDYDYDGEGKTVASYTETPVYWPAKSKRDRPSWLKEVNLGESDVSPLDQSLAELYIALDHDLNGLAGIGVRTTFDIAAELLGADPALSFEEKLTALVEAGHIGQHDKSHIATLIDAGSASAHRGWRPRTRDLRTLMDVLENFILGAFVEPARRKKRDDDIKSIEVPPRPPRPRRAKRARPAVAPSQ